MWNALILFVFMDTANVEQAAIRCEFPGNDLAQKPISVVLEPRPSLKDQPGLFRVIMEMNGRISLRAEAQPIVSTEERDVLIRGRIRDKTMYSVGLREDGYAALNVQSRRVGEDSVRKTTRLGKCRGFETHLMRWLPS